MMSGMPLGHVTAKTIQTCGLPSPAEGGPPNPGEWYHEVQQMEPTRLRGYFGVILGSTERDEDVQLMWYNENNLEPVIRMVIDRDDLLTVFASLGKLLHERLGLLAEWNLTQVDRAA